METLDIIIGTQFLVHLKIYCENCEIDETSQWRKGIK